MARPKPSCGEKAAELLSIRPHFVFELRRKLRQRGYPGNEIESTVERFLELGYLDDEVTARGFVDSRLRRNPIGKLRLGAELGRRGAGRELVSTLVAEISDDEELERARRAAASWSRRSSSGGAFDPDALGRHLGRKGFEKRVILRVLRTAEA